jgi:hypothetical protein
MEIMLIIKAKQGYFVKLKTRFGIQQIEVLLLEGDTVYIDQNRYYLNELTKILGIFQYVIGLSQ